MPNGRVASIIQGMEEFITIALAVFAVVVIAIGIFAIASSQKKFKEIQRQERRKQLGSYPKGIAFLRERKRKLS